MYEVCRRAAAGQNAGDYAKLEKITVESSVTARAPKIAVVTSNRLGWSDLGKWNIIAKMLPADKNGNVTKGNIVSAGHKKLFDLRSGRKVDRGSWIG